MRKALTKALWRVLMRLTRALKAVTPSNYAHMRACWFHRSARSEVCQLRVGTRKMGRCGEAIVLWCEAAAEGLRGGDDSQSQSFPRGACAATWAAQSDCSSICRGRGWAEVIDNAPDNASVRIHSSGVFPDPLAKLANQPTRDGVFPHLVHRSLLFWKVALW